MKTGCYILLLCSVTLFVTGCANHGAVDSGREINFNLDSQTSVSEELLNYKIDTSYYHDITLDSSGLVMWSLNTIDSVNDFIIEEFRWNKWMPIGQVANSQKRTYTFLADTSCRLYNARVKSVGPIVHLSTLVEFPNPTDVKSVCILKRPYLMFTHKTRYELYNEKGERIMEGCDSIVDYDSLNLKGGKYYYSYGNEMAMFLIKSYEIPVDDDQ